MPIHRHVRELDRTSISLTFLVGGAQFWYREGAWLQPWGAGWRSVMPPVGLVVPVLPTRAVARWHGPRELYWVDGVSYQPLVEGGYQVVAPPLVVARAGQSPLEQESDYQSCNRWAMSLPEAIADARIFHDRVTMCMDSRGYSLR
jgi:hypothetical protein